MNAFEYYYDGDLISDLPVPLTEFMKHRGLIAPDHVHINYCGFVSQHSHISVFMPKNSGDRAKSIEVAHSLLQTMNQYYNGKLSGVREGGENELIGNISLVLASSLTEDFFTNGLYVHRKKRYTLNQGRSDWKRTISRHTPFPSEGSLVFLDLETNRTSYVSDCETAKIHAHIIREIQRIYGELLFGKDSFIDERLQQLSEPLGDDEVQLSHLDRELTNTYSERDIQLIRMLKSFIEHRSKVEGAELLVGTRKFHNVWEGMLDACLPNKLQLNKELPVPYYLQDNHFHEVARKGQRTDTVIENDKRTRWAIIDAKYYRALSPADGPGWPDLVKQFFYKTAAEEACVAGVYGSNVTVTLHFVFPGAKQNLLKAKMGKRNQGVVPVDKMESIDKYGEVICHYCDPITLMNHYINDRKLDITSSGDIQEQIFS